MFKQESHGHFTAEVGGEFHCGPDHTSPKKFDWDICITWHDDTVLDTNGFLLDNMGFRAYFNGIGLVTDSCEVLVLKTAKHFFNVAKSANEVTVGLTVPGLARISNTQKR